MTERNIPPCPTHGSLPRALNEHNFFGIITVCEQIIETVSGVGTTSYSRCPYGYEANFAGVVRVLEDLNTSISGIQGGGGSLDPSGILAGSGIYVQPGGSGEIEIGVNIIGEGGIEVTYSGDFVIISGQEAQAIAIISGLAAGPGIDIFGSGDFAVVQTDLIGEGTVDFSYRADTGVISGLPNEEYTGISGIYVSPDNEIMLLAEGQGSVEILYSGNLALISGAESTGGGGGGSGNASIVISGDPGENYAAGALWFDTNEGRLFVYASGNGVTDPAWYQTNAEALALKSPIAPSGTGENAPPRDGSIWFNTTLGSLFIYDQPSSGWYETGPKRSVAYGGVAPNNSVEGAGWYDTSDANLKIWNGSAWVSV